MPQPCRLCPLCRVFFSPLGGCKPAAHFNANRFGPSVFFHLTLPERPGRSERRPRRRQVGVGGSGAALTLLCSQLRAGGGNDLTRCGGRQSFKPLSPVACRPESNEECKQPSFHQPTQSHAKRNLRRQTRALICNANNYGIYFLSPLSCMRLRLRSVASPPFAPPHTNHPSLYTLCTCWPCQPDARGN